MYNTQLNTTKKHIEIEITNWLRHAPERVSREKKAANKVRDVVEIDETK